MTDRASHRGRPQGRALAETALAVASILAAAAVPAEPARAQDDPMRAVPVVVRGAEASAPVVPYVFEGDLRQLPKSPAWRPGDPIKEIPRRYTGPLRGGPPSFGGERTHRDPLLARQEAAVAERRSLGFETPLVNVAGQGFTGVNPPDTVGEVGRSYYVQMVNHGAGSSVVIHDKTDGSIVAGPFILDNLGTGNCASGLGDPIALYDELADRWLLSEFSNFGNRLCVYVSRTADPISGGWFAYDFQASGFPDYPKYAVWPDGYYVATNESRPTVYALERAKMLVGEPATSQRATATELGGFGFQALTPSDLDGAPPPPGSPHYFIRHRDDEAHDADSDPSRDFLEIWAYDVDFADPDKTTFAGPLNIPIAEIDSNICGLFAFSCFDQPGGADLDPLREVVMWRSQYRNFGSYETLVGNLVTDVAVDRGGVRWYELRKVAGSPWRLRQEGTWAPDSHNRWMGSTAMDAQGNLAVGYNISSTTVFPGLRYAGRLATDPPGVLTQGEFPIIAGSGSNASNRYGDYSALNVDPADGCTYWFTGEWNASSNWSTRIAAFRFDTCAGGGGLRIAAIEPCIAGTVNSWRVVGATPGGLVRVICNPAGSPTDVLVGSAIADENGDARIDRFVPERAGGETFECRAGDVEGRELSPVVVKSFP